MRERGLMNLGFSGASRWSASESFLGGYLFDRNYGEFSTGVDTFDGCDEIYGWSGRLDPRFLPTESP